MGIIADHIGKRIVLLRGEMSQKDLAKRSGIHRVQLSKYETGKAVPSDEVLQRLATALECDSLDILGSTEGLKSLASKCDSFQEEIVKESLELLDKITRQRAAEWEELTNLRKENKTLKRQLDKMKQNE